MFRIVNRLIQWTGKYKRRIYIGFIYAFIHSIFTAIPIMLAAKGLSAVLDDFNGVKPLEGRDIWIMLGAMILAVLGRYLFSYLRAITQESVGYEATADERIRLGDILKRVSLGFFSKNNMGELSAAATTDLSFMEMFAMNMVNTVVNGYITVIVLRREELLWLVSFCLPCSSICWRHAATKTRLFIKRHRTIWWKVLSSICEGCRW